ncbi:hypothetical protein EZS27_015346 [termite gut metagenome]|uniref:Uncharacterized protein n=1 Tax=termite gut metagenome TaxID=433724 RepID=A0A5J4RRW6_9ZZZZ
MFNPTFHFPLSTIRYSVHYNTEVQRHRDTYSIFNDTILCASVPLCSRQFIIHRCLARRFIYNRNFTFVPLGLLHPSAKSCLSVFDCFIRAFLNRIRCRNLLALLPESMRITRPRRLGYVYRKFTLHVLGAYATRIVHARYLLCLETGLSVCSVSIAICMAREIL